MVAWYEWSLGRVRAITNLKKMWIDQALTQKKLGKSWAESYAWNMVKQYNKNIIEERSNMLRYDPFWYKTVLDLKWLKSWDMSTDWLISAMYGAKDTMNKYYGSSSKDYYNKKENYYKSHDKIDKAAEEYSYWKKYGRSTNDIGYAYGKESQWVGGPLDWVVLNF